MGGGGLVLFFSLLGHYSIVGFTNLPLLIACLMLDFSVRFQIYMERLMIF